MTDEQEEVDRTDDDLTDRIDRLLDGRHYAEAEDVCTSLLIESPNDFRLFYHRAQAKHLSGRTRDAIGDLGRAIANNEREPALFYFRGLWSLEEAEFAAAERDLGLAVEKESAMGSAYYLESAQLARAVALLMLSDFVGAERQCHLLRPDQQIFLLGRQWRASEVQTLAASRRRA